MDLIPPECEERTIYSTAVIGPEAKPGDIVKLFCYPAGAVLPFIGRPGKFRDVLAGEEHTNLQRCAELGPLGDAAVSSISAGLIGDQFWSPDRMESESWDFLRRTATLWLAVGGKIEIAGPLEWFVRGLAASPDGGMPVSIQISRNDLVIGYLEVPLHIPRRHLPCAVKVSLKALVRR
jgi:hypothetical protein